MMEFTFWLQRHALLITGIAWVTAAVFLHDLTPGVQSILGGFGLVCLVGYGWSRRKTK